MRIAVCVKQAIDETELRLDASGKPVLMGAATKMSTFDKNAVEEGLRHKGTGEVVIFTLGDPDSRKTVKEALAMGADRAVLVVSEPFAYDSLGTSCILAEAIRKSGPFDMVICSEGSSDTYTGQVPPMMAEWLSLPYAGYANKVEVQGSSVKVVRSLEESVEGVELPLPCLVSVVSEINEPRYPTLIQIMQASKKPIEELRAKDLATSNPPLGMTRVLKTTAQAMDRKHVMIDGSPDEAAKKLLDALKAAGVLLR